MSFRTVVTCESALKEGYEVAVNTMMETPIDSRSQREPDDEWRECASCRVGQTQILEAPVYQNLKKRLQASSLSSDSSLSLEGQGLKKLQGLVP